MYMSYKLNRCHNDGPLLNSAIFVICSIFIFQFEICHNDGQGLQNILEEYKTTKGWQKRTKWKSCLIFRFHNCTQNCQGSGIQQLPMTAGAINQAFGPLGLANQIRRWMKKKPQNEYLRKRKSSCVSLLFVSRKTPEKSHKPKKEKKGDLSV